MEQLAGQKLPTSMDYEWTGMSFQEKKVGSEAIMVFALAIILVLSAQYESWTSPAAVIMVVPLVVASGAGAASQQAIGLAVVGGMVAATVMSLTFTPVFYVVMKRLGEKSESPAKEVVVED